ncbi:hypothetical protein Fmac_016909 [Flemingia macrophylla]|uniref:Uncharacterized protein n=1 Tax=Flemingia macrophylla TaxID=520843 RepID=A0ABD1MIQ6_9FABA
MAGALVGSAFLSAFLEVAFHRLASRQVLDFFRGRKLDEKLLSKLKIFHLFSLIKHRIGYTLFSFEAYTRFSGQATNNDCHMSVFKDFFT